LGLSSHPTIIRAEQTPRGRLDQDPRYRQVIYHADPYTLYSLTPPVLSYHGGDDPGDGPLHPDVDNGDPHGVVQPFVSYIHSRDVSACPICESTHLFVSI
jgi:hypothetical protein